MKFIESLKEGMHVSEVYLCKTKTIAMSKTGKEYASLSLHDKTGSIDAKIWDLYSPGISDVDAMTFVVVDGDVTSFNNVLMRRSIHRPTMYRYLKKISTRCLVN